MQKEKERREPTESMAHCLSDISFGFTSEIDDKCFVKVLKEKERADLWKTFLFVVERLLKCVWCSKGSDCESG